MSVVEAKIAETIPDLAENEPCRYFSVGGNYICADGQAISITRITVQSDEPGLHGYLRRVCIWSDETLLAEFPYLAAGFVGYL